MTSFVRYPQQFPRPRLASARNLDVKPAKALCACSVTLAQQNRGRRGFNQRRSIQCLAGRQRIEGIDRRLNPSTEINAPLLSGLGGFLGGKRGLLRQSGKLADDGN